MQYVDHRDAAAEEARERWNKHNLAIPALPEGGVTHFDPSGLVPYPCTHGLATKPKRYGVMKQGGNARLGENGEELPPFGGWSWGRAKFLTITAFGARSGVPYCLVACPVCLGQPEPADMTTPADET